MKRNVNWVEVGLAAAVTGVVVGWPIVKEQSRRVWVQVKNRYTESGQEESNSPVESGEAVDPSTIQGKWTLHQLLGALARVNPRTPVTVQDPDDSKALLSDASWDGSTVTLLATNHVPQLCAVELMDRLPGNKDDFVNVLFQSKRMEFVLDTVYWVTGLSVGPDGAALLVHRHPSVCSSEFHPQWASLQKA